MSRRSQRWGVLLGAAIVAAGCTSVLGDFHLGAGGHDADANDASSGGSAGTGPGGSAGTTSSGGSAGSGGADAGCKIANDAVTASIFAPNENDPEAIALGRGSAGDYVYWIDRAGNEVRSAAESGQDAGMATTLYPSGQGGGSYGFGLICTDANGNAYWTDNTTSDSEVIWWSPSGHSATAIYGAGPTGGLFAVAADTTNVYYSYSLATTGQTLSWVQSQGGPSEPLVAVVNGQNDAKVEQLALTPQYVYLTADNSTTAYLEKAGVPFSAREQTKIVGNTAGPAGAIAATSDGAYVFWASGDALRKYVAGASDQTFENYGGSLRPSGVAVYNDGTTTWVYWTLVPRTPGGPSGMVMRRDVNGSLCSQVIARGQSDPVAIAVDSSGVYWVNAGPNGNVTKATLP